MTKKAVYSSLVSSLLRKSDDASHILQIKWGNTHEKGAIKAFMFFFSFVLRWLLGYRDISSAQNAAK